MRAIARIVRALALVTFLAASSTSARAQSSDDSGIIAIVVRDAASKKALPDARITLLGATQASALTNGSGTVRYTDVPSGIYRVRVAKRGFIGNTSPSFEILGNKEVDVDIDLASGSPAGPAPAASSSADTGGIKVIGRVSARISVVTRDVDGDSAIRRVSDSLTDALSKIAGVDVTQTTNDPDAAQTISLNGHDESQTAVTLDGIPLGAPGQAVNLRSINTDLFGGAGVSFAPQAGSLGGSVNFRTLQPTQTWVTRLAASYGTFDKFNYQLGETGSIGKLGIAVLHTLREQNNPLTFNTYTDTSGLTYPHAGESSNVGDFIKLRYGVDDRTTLNFTVLQNNSGVSSLNTQDVTLVPSGIGPGNTTSDTFQFAYATVQTLIGNVTTSLSAYVNSNNAYANEALRYVDGTPHPLVSNTDTLARGVAFLSTIDIGRSTWTLSGSTYDSATRFSPLVNSSAFVVPSTVASDAQSYALADLYKINDRLSLGPTASLASTEGSGTLVLAGVAGTWRPQAADTYAASVNVGSSQPQGSLIRTFSDPSAARFNCAAGTATVSGPGDPPGKQSAISYDANWTHTWRSGSLAADVYRQTEADQLVNAQIVATSLGLGTGDPYIAALQSYFSGPDTCGATSTLLPQNVYVNEAIGNTTRVYEGFTLSGRVALGPHLVAIPSYQTNGAIVTAADARLSALNSTTIVGRQIPGRPVHRGNLTLDGDIPRLGLEVLANAQYVGPNNAQHISPYTLLSLGAAHALGVGRLAFLETNVFDTESAPLSSLLFAQPIPTTGGGLLYEAANPNPPRQFTLTYSFNTGARTGAGGARPSRSAARAGAASIAASLADPSSAAPQRARGLGAFTPFPPPPGVDPLSVAEKRDSCTPEDATLAAPVLAALHAAADAYAAGKPLPPTPGVTLTPHGDRGGDWYFEVRPDLPRRPDAPSADANGGRGFGRSGGGGPPEARGAPQSPASPAAPEHLDVAARTAAPGPRATADPARRAAFANFRATLSCAYFSALAQSDARKAGYTAFVGRNGLGYAPRIGLFAMRPPELTTGGGSLKP